MNKRTINVVFVTFIMYHHRYMLSVVFRRQWTIVFVERIDEHVRHRMKRWDDNAYRNPSMVLLSRWCSRRRVLFEVWRSIVSESDHFTDAITRLLFSINKLLDAFSYSITMTLSNAGMIRSLICLVILESDNDHYFVIVSECYYYRFVTVTSNHSTVTCIESRTAMCVHNAKW